MNFPLLCGGLLIASLASGNYFSDASADGQKRMPIVLVPGIEGSQLQAKLTNKPKTVSPFCEKNADWFNIWISPLELLPLVIDCFIDNMKLNYNSVTRRTYNQPGVEVRTAELGPTETVEYLVPDLEIEETSCYKDLVDAFVTREGYTRGVDILGAPYDFRRSAYEQEEYFFALKNLIERAVHASNASSALFCHSMGCLMSSYFLNHQTREWKDKYIHTLVAVSAPWGGTVKALKAFASGDNLGIFVYKDTKLRNLEQSYSSLAFLLPSYKMWTDSDNFVTTPERSYGPSDYKEFFADINDATGYEMWLDSKDLTSDLDHPGTAVICAHGTGLDTVAQLVYKDAKSFPAKPDVVHGDGDGTVNRKSLEGCLKWQENSGHKFNYQVYPGKGHVKLLKDSKFINMIIDELKTIQ